MIHRAWSVREGEEVRYSVRGLDNGRDSGRSAAQPLHLVSVDDRVHRDVRLTAHEVHARGRRYVELYGRDRHGRSLSDPTLVLFLEDAVGDGAVLWRHINTRFSSSSSSPPFSRRRQIRGVRPSSPRRCSACIPQSASALRGLSGQSAKTSNRADTHKLRLVFATVIDQPEGTGVRLTDEQAGGHRPVWRAASTTVGLPAYH